MDNFLSGLSSNDDIVDVPLPSQRKQSFQNMKTGAKRPPKNPAAINTIATLFDSSSDVFALSSNKISPKSDLKSSDSLKEFKIENSSKTIDASVMNYLEKSIFKFKKYFLDELQIMLSCDSQEESIINALVYQIPYIVESVAKEEIDIYKPVGDSPLRNIMDTLNQQLDLLKKLLSASGLLENSSHDNVQKLSSKSQDLESTFSVFLNNLDNEMKQFCKEREERAYQRKTYISLMQNDSSSSFKDSLKQLEAINYHLKYDESVLNERKNLFDEHSKEKNVNSTDDIRNRKTLQLLQSLDLHAKDISKSQNRNLLTTYDAIHETSSDRYVPLSTIYREFIDENLKLGNQVITSSMHDPKAENIKDNDVVSKVRKRINSIRKKREKIAPK